MQPMYSPDLPIGRAAYALPKRFSGWWCSRCTPQKIYRFVAQSMRSPGDIPVGGAAYVLPRFTGLWRSRCTPQIYRFVAQSMYPQDNPDYSCSVQTKIWNDKNIAISSKIRLMRSLVMSMFVHARETRTITADIERRIQALEMRCFRKLFGISYRDHITNEEVQAIGPYEDLLTSVKRRKLKWYGHITRSSGLAKTILQGTVQGGRRRSRQRKRWEDNINEWTGNEWNILLRRSCPRDLLPFSPHTLWVRFPKRWPE